MTKKEKILYSYLSNIIEDENPNTIFINTTRDISKLIKRIEKLNIQSLQIGPDIEQISNENFDLFVILDDIQTSEPYIGMIKNLISHKIAIFTNFKNNNLINETMLKLGFETELLDKSNNNFITNYLDLYRYCRNNRIYFNPNCWRTSLKQFFYHQWNSMV